MLTVYKKVAESVLTPLVKPLAKVNPNLLTLLGSIPSILFFVAIVTQQYILALLTFVLQLVDLLDGMVARKYKKVTNFGGFFDSTMDRIADFLLITAFAFGGLVRWEIVAPLLLFSYLTSYMRSRGELANPKVSFAIGVVERTERIVLVFVSLLLFLLFPNLTLWGLNITEICLTVITILSFYTVLERFYHAYRKLD